MITIDEHLVMRSSSAGEGGGKELATQNNKKRTGR